MPTLNAAMAAIERHIGFPKSRARQVARRLQEAQVLPLGGPGIAPELDVDNVVSLIVALAADTDLHEAPGAVARYRALTPGGTDLSGAPADVMASAGLALDILADIAIHTDGDQYRRHMIEVVSNWPEIAIHDAVTGKTTRFVPVGALASHWQANGHRHSITINGAAFVDAIHELFGDKQ